MSVDVRAELRRKAWHLLLLFYLVGYHLAGREAFLLLMSAWTLLIFAVETLRLRSDRVNRFLSEPFAGILRPKELTGYSGVLYTTLGCFAAGWLYGDAPRLISGAILSLALADSAAAIVGMAWGRLRFSVRGKTRSVEGAAAAFAVACVCGLAAGLGWPVALSGAGAVAALDFIPAPPDDNFWIPVAFAAAAGAAAGVPPRWAW